MLDSKNKKLWKSNQCPQRINVLGGKKVNKIFMSTNRRCSGSRRRVPQSAAMIFWVTEWRQHLCWDEKQERLPSEHVVNNFSRNRSSMWYSGRGGTECGLCTVTGAAGVSWRKWDLAGGEAHLEGRMKHSEDIVFWQNIQITCRPWGVTDWY